MIYINDVEIEFSAFPNGEILVNTDILNNIDKNIKSIRVDFKWQENEDLLNLYFAIKHLRYTNNDKYLPIDLYVYYMPYSRMDRSQNGSCFTLFHVSSLINSILLPLDKVYIVEPHSDVALKLIPNSTRINAITPLMKNILKLNPGIDVICYPDKGAKARFQDDSVNLPIVYCEKVRDFESGNITGLNLVTTTSVINKNVLILDDLCSAGGTFYYTALELKKAGVKDVFLGVCHMEQNIVNGKLFKEESPINHIYCFDTMINKLQIDFLNLFKNITVYSIEDFLKKGEIKNANTSNAISRFL